MVIYEWIKTQRAGVYIKYKLAQHKQILKFEKEKNQKNKSLKEIIDGNIKLYQTYHIIFVQENEQS